MGTARLVSMIAQPSQVSYLAFEVGGILDTCAARLGGAVNDIPYGKLCDPLKSGKTTAADPSRLIHDAAGLEKMAAPVTLATLRNEDRKAALDNAVNARQNAYFAKYAGAPQIISTIRGSYSRTSPASKANQLDYLSDMAEEQYAELQQAYMDDDRTGVVKTTVSSIQSSTRSSGDGTRASAFTQETVGRVVGNGARLPHIIPWPSFGFEALRFNVRSAGNTALTVGKNYEWSDSTGVSTGSQSAEHADYEYRTPALEARARKTRAQISLIDQKFEVYMFGQNIPHLEKVFENELNSIDNDVYQFQISLLRTFLTSPEPGIVTGVYKRPGEAVSAGEPVIRVEHNGIVQLVAILVHRGVIAIGATATVTATLSGAAGATTILQGAVIAARGMGDGDRWEVVVEAPNLDGAGNAIVPLNYVFDREFTTFTIA